MNPKKERLPTRQKITNPVSGGGSVAPEGFKPIEILKLIFFSPFIHYASIIPKSSVLSSYFLKSDSSCFMVHSS